MTAQLAQELHHEIDEPLRVTRSWRARVVLALGPLTVAAGFVWAFVQPWRLTILDPYHQGLWWLVSEPPLYVVLVGVVFRVVVAPALAQDVDES
jgi:hypothetical protein